MAAATLPPRLTSATGVPSEKKRKKECLAAFSGPGLLAAPGAGGGGGNEQ